MKYLSLFSGIGGFELGIGPEHECVGFSEIDKYAVSVYHRHFYTHKNYGDITKIREDELSDFDFLVGGFPCQAFSIAGKRGGFNDTRGTLFFDIARILGAKRPRLFVLENVKGLLSHDGGRTFSTIIATLDELGYDTQWQVLNSKNHGVPQNRERVFIVGHLRGTRRPEVFPFGESNPTTMEQIIGGGQGNRVYDTNGVSSTIASQAGGRGAKTGLYAIGGTQAHQKVRDDGISPTLTSAMGMGGGQTPPIIQKSPDYREDGSLRMFDKTSPTIRANMGDNHPMVAKTVRSGGRGSPHGSKQNWDSYNVSGGIRRLTPVECMRLQGFPDHWCDFGVDGNAISDTQKYKMAGNAVTVNVVRDIMSRLL
jgi:DNA (cytosine-5)-methyltransferase 1